MKSLALVSFDVDKEEARSHLISNISAEAGMGILGQYTPEEWNETLKAVSEENLRREQEEN